MNIKTPQTTEEAAAIFNDARAAGLAIIPAGRLTKLRHDPAIQNEDAAIISTRALNRVVAVEPENLLAVVEAGVTPEALATALAPTGLYWPVTGLDGRSLGGIIADGLSGAECMSRGTTVDWILGAAFITPAGQIVRSGGRTLKNVSGYDFTRLAWRSRGRLGLAVEFILKLLPHPAASKILEVETAGPAEAAAFCRRIIGEKLWPDALRIEIEDGRVVVAVWFAGFEQVVEIRTGQALVLAENGKAATVHEDGAAYWQARQNKWPIADSSFRALLGSRAAVLVMVESLAGTKMARRLKADFDIGGGRVLLAAGQKLPKLPEGLAVDRFVSKSPVYQRVKKTIDPEDVLFPGWLTSSDSGGCA